MINIIKFQMMNKHLTIPVYSDWIKSKSLDIEEWQMVLSPANNLPVHPAIAFNELDLGYIIYVDNNTEVGPISIRPEMPYVTAMEFDLIHRSVKIGWMDTQKIADIDKWTYVDGLPVQLNLSMNILESDSGKMGLSISATDNLGIEVLKRLGELRSDLFITVDDGVSSSSSVGIDAYNLIVSSVSNSVAFDEIVQTINETGENNIHLGTDIDLHLEMSIITGDDGKSTLVLHAKDDVGAILIHHILVGSLDEQQIEELDPDAIPDANIEYTNGGVQ